MTEHRPRPGPTVLTEDGHTLTTQLLGRDSWPRVVLQHGVGSSTTFLLEAVAPPLVAAGWTVVAADLRGHGAGSPVRDPQGYELPRLAHDVGVLVAATDAVACGGVSLGGHAAVASVIAGHVRPRAVVAALPAWLGASAPGIGAHAAVAEEIRTVGVAGMRARLTDSDGLRPWLRRVLLRDLAAHDDPSLEAALVALDGGVAPSLEELVMLQPALGVVAWPDDPGHPIHIARAWAKAAAGSTLVTLDIGDLDVDQHALGRAVLAALGRPPVLA